MYYSVILFRNFCVWFVFFISYTSLFSQEKAIYNAIYNNERLESMPLFSDWMLDFQYGINRFKGDITEYSYYPAYQQSIKFYELKKGYNIGLIRRIPPFFRLSARYNRGKIAGLRRALNNEDILFLENSYDPYNLYKGSGQKFITEFNQLDFLVKTNIKAVYSYFLKTKIPKSIRQVNYGNTEIDLGVGYNIFHSQRSNLNSEEYIYSYGYDLVDAPDAINKQPIFLQEKQFVLIYGISSEYILNEKLNIAFSYHIIYGTNDKWDGLVAESDYRYDKYTRLSLGLAYRLE